VNPPASTASTTHPARPRTRRFFLLTGTAALASASVAFLAALARSWSRVLYEPARRFPADGPETTAGTATCCPSTASSSSTDPTASRCSPRSAHLGCTVATDEKGATPALHGSVFDAEVVSCAARRPGRSSATRSPSRAAVS